MWSSHTFPKHHKLTIKVSSNLLLICESKQKLFYNTFLRLRYGSTKSPRPPRSQCKTISIPANTIRIIFPDLLAREIIFKRNKRWKGFNKSSWAQMQKSRRIRIQKIWPGGFFTLPPLCPRPGPSHIKIFRCRFTLVFKHSDWLNVMSIQFKHKCTLS